MVVDTALLWRFEKPSHLSDQAVEDVYKRLDKASYDAFVFSQDGYRLSVKSRPSQNGKISEAVLLCSAVNTLSLDIDYHYDLPYFLTVRIDLNTYSEFKKLEPAIYKGWESKDHYSFRGINYDLIKTIKTSPESKVKAVGEGVVCFEESVGDEGVTFTYQYEDGRRDGVFTPYITTLPNVDFEDISGPLMIPRIIAWGDLRDIDLAREHLNFDAVMAERTEASITAIAGRLRRWDDSEGTDEALKMLLETDFAQQYFTEIVNAAESALPEDVVADLKMMITEKSLSGVAVQSKRKLSRI